MTSVVLVEVKFLSHCFMEAGIKKIKLKTVRTMPEAIKEIEKQTGFPLDQKLKKGYSLIINGRSYLLLQKDGYLLKDGDVLAVLPKLGGG